MEQSRVAWKSYEQTTNSLKWRPQCLSPVLLLSVLMAIVYLIIVHQQGVSMTPFSSTSSFHRGGSVKLGRRGAPVQALFAQPMPREQVGMDNEAKTRIVQQQPPPPPPQQQQQQQQARRSELLSVHSRVEGASLDAF